MFHLCESPGITRPLKINASRLNATLTQASRHCYRRNRTVQDKERCKNPRSCNQLSVDEFELALAKLLKPYFTMGPDRIPAT